MQRRTSLGKSRPPTPLRKTPTQIAMSISNAGTSKMKGSNAMNMKSIDKFSSGLKSELLSKYKEEKEKINREM